MPTLCMTGFHSKLYYLGNISFSSRTPNGIVVRAHASRAKSLQSESDLMAWLNARSLFTQQQMGTLWQHWGDKGGEEKNWSHPTSHADGSG